MKVDVAQYLNELVGIGQDKGVNLDNQAHVLMSIYSGLLDNSPEHFAPFLNLTEMLGYAQSMYMDRMPDFPSSKVLSLNDHILSGEERLLTLYPNRALSDNARKTDTFVNPFDSDSLAQRIEYGLAKLNAQQTIETHKSARFTPYIPKREAWRRETEPEEHYELFPSEVNPSGDGRIAESIGYLVGITRICEELVDTSKKPKFDLKAYNIEREQLIPSDEVPVSKRVKKKKTVKETPEYNPFTDEDAQKDFQKQHEAELREEFEGFDPQYHDTGFHKREDSEN